jgi:hypothetical protein
VACLSILAQWHKCHAYGIGLVGTHAGLVGGLWKLAVKSSHKSASEVASVLAFHEDFRRDKFRVGTTCCGLLEELFKFPSVRGVSLIRIFVKCTIETLRHDSVHLSKLMMLRSLS